jgi:hypothetical protein
MADDEPKIDWQMSEEERKRRALALSQELALKYDPTSLSRIVVNEAGRGEHLDIATQMEMESRLGGTFGNVRVFRGPFAESITRQHGADAVTVGATGMILMREGPRSDPKTALGKALLAHELTHVAQAQQGLHFALEGGHSQSAPHEKEAEAAEAKVHGEESGGGGGGEGGHGGPHGEEKLQLLTEKVLEIWEEHARLQSWRLGERY